MMDTITLNKPMIDWLTITTFDADSFHDIAKNWRGFHQFDDNSDGKISIMGYKGWQYDRVQFGVKEITHGKHAGSDHYIIRATGATAHEFGSFMRNMCMVFPSLKLTLRCTRIDLQITVSGALIPARHLADDLRTHLDYGRGRPPKVTLIESDTNTVYIGSRQSERYVRFYEKMVDGFEICTRYEIEYKGGQARNVWSRWLLSANSLKETLGAEFYRYPAILAYRYLPLSRILGALAGAHPPAPKTIKQETNTAKWLTTQVDSAIENLKGSHDTMLSLLPLFQKWVNLAQSSIAPAEEQ